MSDKIVPYKPAPQPWEHVYIGSEIIHRAKAIAGALGGGESHDIPKDLYSSTKTLPIIYVKPKIQPGDPVAAKFNLGDIVMVGRNGIKAEIQKVFEYSNSSGQQYVIQHVNSSLRQCVDEVDLSLAIPSRLISTESGNVASHSDGAGPKCDCGTDFVGGGKHSSWCSKIGRE